MEREQAEIGGEGLDRHGTVIRYGHWGRPVLVFPSEQGRAWDYENNGMIGAIADLIDGGRVKVYCVDSFDHLSWSNRSAGLEDRARAHQAYEAWIVRHVVPTIHHDSPDAAPIIATGCSLGAYHALNITLKHGDVFGQAICQSGSYDPSEWHGWGERGDAAYFSNPCDYVPNLHGDHLDWLRSRIGILLTVGQGAWETHPTRSLPSTRRMAGLLADKGLPYELDEWGHDVSHDWPWWQRQIAHHLPRFC